MKDEVGFGLENLSKVYESISYISESDAESLLKVPALTYECFGYYNAIEHLILRLTKYLKIPTLSGACRSHGEGVSRITQSAKETAPGQCCADRRSKPHCGEWQSRTEAGEGEGTGSVPDPL